MGATPRLALHYPELPDLADVPADMHTLALQLDNVMPYNQGPLASRPVSSPGTPGIMGRIYRSTDESPNVVYLDTGTGWIAIGAVADGAIGTLQLADRSVTGIKIALATILGENVAAGTLTGDKLTDLTITAGKLAAALKPSQGAGAATEALRALGVNPGNAASGLHASQHLPGGPDPIDETLFPTVPIGAVLDWPYASSDMPAWALLCAGQAISRATYPLLHARAAAAGYPHGAGDGVNTFNLPDYRGRVGIGKDDMGGTAASRMTVAISGVSGGVLGAVGGSEGITLTIGQIPSHTHQNPAFLGAGSGSADATWKYAFPGVDSVDNRLIAGAVGGGGAHSNVQPVVIVNKIIRVK